MDSPITRAEHNEFMHRMEDEHKRINHRIEEVESKTDTLAKLTASVESIAESVKTLTAKVAALSPCHPSTIAPTSTLTTSPSFKTLLPGIP